MVNDINLGEFEALVLIALLRLGNNAYGVTIKREIEEHARRTAPLGSVYASLERLEGKGYAKSIIGKATAERGGRRKKYFHITSAGQVRLTSTLSGIDRMLRGTRLSGISTASGICQS